VAPESALWQGEGEAAEAEAETIQTANVCGSATSSSDHANGSLTSSSPSSSSAAASDRARRAALARRKLELHRRLASMRSRAVRTWWSDGSKAVREAVDTAVKSGSLAVRDDRAPHADLGLQEELWAAMRCI